MRLGNKRSTCNPLVAGSNPAAGAETKKNPVLGFFFVSILGWGRIRTGKGSGNGSFPFGVTAKRQRAEALWSASAIGGAQ